jgi:DegV family protein with EDD domain
VRSACAALQGDLVQADVHILDTRTVAANLGTMVQLAVAWAEAGRGAEGILADLHAMIPRSRSFFAVRTLEYLQRGGRIGKAAALAANALSIKPILELRDGIVQPLERVRTYARALDRLAELVLAQCPPGAESHLAVMHCGAAAEAAALASRLHSIDGQGDIPVYQVGAAIAAHAGPGVVGAAFFASA